MSVIGLVTERNVVDRSKLINFILLLNTNYSKAKELLGLSGDEIYMNVTDPQNNLIYLDTMPASGGMPPNIVALQAAHTGSTAKVSAILRANNSIAILFDQSGSMGDNLPAEGRSKLDAAKLAFNNFLFAILPDDEIGLTTFRDCSGPGPYTAQNFTSDLNLVRLAVNGMSANGLTPLAGGTTYAANFINGSARNSNRVLIVFSDGEETCNGNPSAAATYAMTRGVGKIDTIGFVLADNSTGAIQLKQMASIGRGTYYSANTSVELQQALEQAYSSSEAQVVVNVVIWQ